MAIARRRFVLAVAAAAVGQPALGQPSRGQPWRVGILSARRRPASLESDYYGVFPRRMRELGYVEGRNLVIEWRFAEGDYERLAGMARDLVERDVDVILALGPPGVAAAQKATRTVPIVFVVSVDPVRAGFVQSLARPGGNATGISNLAGDLTPKHLELLAAMRGKLDRVALLVNPANPVHAGVRKNLESAAQKSGVTLLYVEARTTAELDRAFARIGAERAGGLIVALDPLFIQQAPEIAAHAARLRLPSIFGNAESAHAGGLMSYGQNQPDIYFRAAGYVDRILRGTKPADMPVEQPTTLELVINAHTAKAIGVSVPPAMRAAADVVIE